jgi:hypothetical protein
MKRRTGRHRGGADHRELERVGQRADALGALGVEDLGDLRAASDSGLGAGQFAHRGRAVREGAQPRRERLADAQAVEHRRNVDLRGGVLRIGKVDRAGRHRAGLQRLRRGDIGQRFAVAHRQTRAHATQRRALGLLGLRDLGVADDLPDLRVETLAARRRRALGGHQPEPGVRHRQQGVARSWRPHPCR